MNNNAFSHIDTWIFDLDNTLYSPVHDLFSQVDDRMRAFISNYLGVSETEAHRIQKTYYVEHGTTLHGLMNVHGMDPTDFLDFVHDIDVSHLPADPDLGQAISQLPGRKVIFTNGSLQHARNVAGQLEIAHHFDGMYDIAAVDFEPKPKRAAYDRFLEVADIAPGRAVMFEDIARNLEVPHAVGMGTVWVRPPSRGQTRHEQIAHEGADGAHIHHTTDDLTGFLLALQD